MVQSVLLGGQRALSPPSRCCDPITREGGGLGRGANRSHDFWGRHRAGARPPEAERGSRHHKTTPATRIEEGTGKCLYQATLLIYKNPNIYWVFNYTSEIVLISLHLDHSVLPSPREGVPSAAPLYRWGNRGTGPGRESQSEWEFGSGHPETRAQVLTSAPRRPSNAPVPSGWGTRGLQTSVLPVITCEWGNYRKKKKKTYYAGSVHEAVLTGPSAFH